MRVFIFSYPLHYHISQLAARSAFFFIPNIDAVTFVWDDLGFKRLSNLNLGKRLQQTLPGSDLIKTSQLDYCQDESNGWLRQQYVKLNLHRYTDEPCIVLDGDTVLRNPTTFTDLSGDVLIHGDPWEHYEPYFDFIRHALNLEKESTPSFMSPYWLCDPSVLRNLELDIQQCHGDTLVNVFKKYHSIDHNRTLSEVELYGLYAQSIGYPMQWVERNLKCCLAREFVTLWSSTNDNLCLGGRDNFGSLWWEQQGIEYQQDLDLGLNC